MSYRISYQRKALNEYDSAIQWYRQRSEKAAENFESAIKDKIEILRTAPDQYKQKYKQYHEVALKKYPYSIVYLIDEKETRVVISSIHHHKRHPRLKYNK